MRISDWSSDVCSSDLTVIKAIEIEGININDLPVSFADSKAFKALGLDKRPALLLGMDSLSLFDRVEIDFPNKRVVLDMPSGVHRETGRRYADAGGMRSEERRAGKEWVSKCRSRWSTSH